MSVGEAFVLEQPRLLALPPTAFETTDRQQVAVGKTPYARFDLNDYSVPHRHVRQLLTVVASDTRVRVLDGLQVIAEHERCYAKGEQIEDPLHIQELRAAKQRAHNHSQQNRLVHAAPSSVELLNRAVRERGHRPGAVIDALTELLDGYGGNELELAIVEALQQQVPHAAGVRQLLERRRELRQQPPPLAIPLPEHARTVVRPASLAGYDDIERADSDQEQDDE